MEIWKEIDPSLYPQGGYGQTYSVSNHGRVRNNKSGRILKNRLEKKGYYKVNLATKEFKVHRLVAIHFIDNPNNYDQVNHIDGNKINNNVENLEWCNGSYNQEHAHKLGLKSSVGSKNGNSRLTEEDVLYIWKSDLTASEIAQEYGVSEGYAQKLINKETWKSLIPLLEQDAGSTTIETTH